MVLVLGAVSSLLGGATLVSVICAWMIARFRRLSNSRVGITYGPLSARDEQRQNNLRIIYHSDDTHCVNLLRMRRAPFFQLCDLFLLRDSIHCNTEEQVVMFLHVVSHNQRFRCIEFPFRRSIETISRYFQEVLFAVGELRAEMILPPLANVPARIQNSRHWNPYFKVPPAILGCNKISGYTYPYSSNVLAIIVGLHGCN
jgi:hypothetical protein